MKKTKLFAASIAAMALVGCTSEDYVGVVDNPTGDGIGFGSGVTATTRANSTGSQAAEKLNNNFIVYGFKTNTAESEDQVVFDRYNVNYEAGTANTTESNTADWEYVGLANHDGSINPQTIKYWDFSRDKYVFSAVSGTGITAKKTTTGSTIYDKGWEVEIPAGGDISTLYASDRVVATKDGSPLADGNKVEGKYKETVKLTFRSLITKIRFAMYEVIPGYEVHIDKFYYGSTGAWNNTETNFAIDGTFKTANANDVTPLIITYYNNESGIENRPKVSYEDSKVTSANYGIFGANIQATPAIGTTSAEATYDQSDKSYTLILPYESSALATPEDNNLELYVDYTLKSTDGSGETIKVWHASAKVPTNFTQWKPNFAYTYIFKISDNTNGTTVDPGSGPTYPDFDPNDPESTPDPEKIGLFPITFDAVVITDETDVQETITTVSDVSITTYAKGTIVTENNEYIDASDVYVTVMDNGTLMSNLGAVSAVYEVHNSGTIETKITEEVVANWANNFCTLTPVNADVTVTNVPLINGTNLTFTAGQVVKFTAKAGKVYAFKYINATGDHYKVIRVKGAEDAVTNSLSSSLGTGAITTTGGTATLTLTQDDVAVFGAAPSFEVTSTGGNKALKIAAAGAGTYTVSVDQDAIKAGEANDTYTVKFGDKSVEIKVNIAYALDPASVSITAGNTTGATTTLKIAGAAADGDITDVPAGITIEKTATGTYKVTATSTVANGSYSAKIAGQTLTITVDGYAFMSDLVITKSLGGGDTGTLTLQKNGAAASGTHALTGTDDAIATNSETDGVYTFTAVAGGSFDVTYENAKAKVTVNAYTITAADASITAPTASTVLTVKKNGEAINATVGKVIVTATIPGRGDCVPEAGGVDYSLTTNGSTLLFRPSTAGSYNFTYVEDGKQVAVATVTVTE